MKNLIRQPLTLRVTLVLLSLILGSANIASDQYLLVPKNSTMTVMGTSTMHDWHMKAEKMVCEIFFKTNTGGVKTIEKVNFSVKATQIKSDNSTMDKKAYEALKAGKYPDIKFTGLSVTDYSIKGEKMNGVITGELNLAGAKKKISFPFNGTISNTNQIKIKGSPKIKMSEFGIEPPTAMLGTIKTGDEVTISFELQFSPSNQL